MGSETGLEYLKRPVGVAKGLSIFLGVVTLGFCIVSRPGVYMREAVLNPGINDESPQVWRIDFYLSMVIISLICNIVLYGVHVFLNVKSTMLRYVEGALSLFLLTVLVSSSAVLIEEQVDWWFDTTWTQVCNDLHIGQPYEQEVMEAQAQCRLENADRRCSCTAQIVGKMPMNLASLIAGLYYVGVYFTHSVLSFFK